MSPDVQDRCRTLLDRIGGQLTAVVPTLTLANYSGAPLLDSVIPTERLPLLVESVRTYIEAEAVYAQAIEQPMDVAPSPVD